MKNNFTSRIKILLISILSVSIIAFALSFFYSSELIYNNLSQELEVKQIEKTTLLELIKREEQGAVHGLEIEISGTSNKSIELLLGSTPGQLTNRLLIKKGEIDLDLAFDWYEDNCYLLISEDESRKGDIKISYRFQASSRN